MAQPMTAASLYGTAPVVTATVTHPAAADAAMPGKTGWRSMVDPHNPLVWFGAILLITVGAAGVAGSARVGPAKVTGALGKGA